MINNSIRLDKNANGFLIRSLKCIPIRKKSGRPQQ